MEPQQNNDVPIGVVLDADVNDSGTAPLQNTDITVDNYYSSFRPDSVSLYHAHSRVVLFHTLNRDQRDTRLFSLISYISLRCTLVFAPPQESYFTSRRHSSPLSPSVVSAAASRTPSRSIPNFYHHSLPNRAP